MNIKIVNVFFSALSLYLIIGVLFLEDVVSFSQKVFLVFLQLAILFSCILTVIVKED